MLGKQVKDKVTGFTGIVTAHVKYLNGCEQYCVKPQAESNKMPEGEYIDVGQIEEVPSGKDIGFDSKGRGGPQRDQPQG